MAQLSKQALIVENNSSFPNNTSNYITPAILRSFNTDMIDSLVDENTYNSDSASWNSKIVNVSSSALITASVTLNTITFTKGDLTTFNITVNTGSGGGGTTDITSLNAFTASQQTQNATLAPVTASLITSASTSAAANALNVTKWNNIAAQSGSWGITSGSVPGGTISSSAQIVGLGFLQTSSFQTYTSSIDSKFTSVGASTSSLNAFSASTAYSVLYLSQATQSLNAFTASAQISLNTLNSFTSSANTQLTNLSTSQSIDNTKWNNISSQSGSWGASAPAGTISGSAQIVGLGFLQTSSFNAYTQSNDTKWNTLGGQTGSYITSAQTSSMSVATASVAQAVSTSISTQNLQHFVTFVDNSTGTQAIYVDGGLKYNPNLDLILTGNITASGYISASSLNLASTLTASLQTGYVWVGNGSNVSTIVATSSFAGSTINTGSFATTGSNVFVGNQQIQGGLLMSGSLGITYGNTGNVVITQVTSLGNYQLLYNSNILYQTNGTTMWHQTIPTYFDLPTTFQSSSFFQNKASFQQGLEVTGSTNINQLTASLQQGYTWVGGTNNISTLVATSSFGGSTINTGSFATTGSNTFIGNQTITGSTYILGNTTITGVDADVTVKNVGFVVDAGPYTFNRALATDTGGGVYSGIGIDNTINSEYNFGFVVNSYSDRAALTNTLYGGGNATSGPFSGSSDAMYFYNAKIDVVKPLQVSGSLSISGSAHGNVVSMSITSNTASMDFNAGNYFELTASVSPLNINVINLSKGTTSTLSISGSTASTITFSPNVQQPSGSAYTASVSGQTDILSFVAFNTSKVNVVSTIKMV